MKQTVSTAFCFMACAKSGEISMFMFICKQNNRTTQTLTTVHNALPLPRLVVLFFTLRFIFPFKKLNEMAHI